MNTYTLYRLLDVKNQRIIVSPYNFHDDHIVLNEINVEYDNSLEALHKEMIVEAIDKQIQAARAKVHMLEMTKQKFMLIGHKGPIEGELC